ncbi:MAG: 6-phosphogluconolactonase [Chlamydiae bacterium]|nr:6-phosphogluconolactonase [Chlamydiota bacterium]
MIGEWIEIRDIFKLLQSSAQRTIGHSTIFVVAKPQDHLYYLESFTKTIITDYPSRYILIKEEENAEREFLKAKLTFLETAKGSNRFCEFIEIEFTPNQKERLSTSLSKFALPKLDVFLVLWQRDHEHKPIFDALKHIATRIIFDSEYADDPRTVLEFMDQCPSRVSIGDLTYTRGYSIREVLIKELTAPQLAPIIDQFHTLKISYNPCFNICSAVPMQSLYAAEWLATWGKKQSIFKMQNAHLCTVVYDHAKVIIEQGEPLKELGEGKILSLELIGPNHTFELKRDRQSPDKIFTSIKSNESCSVPAIVNTDDLQIGLSLMRQLQYDQTNRLQIESLKHICEVPFKRLVKYKSSDEALYGIKERILNIGRKEINFKGVFRIALSGGKTPMTLYRSFQPQDLDWDKVEIFFSDERQVPPDHSDSNYKNAMEALGHLPLKGENIHRMIAEQDVDNHAFAYERLIRPSIDVCLLGMGADGHTLSIFPGSEAIKVRDRLVVPANGLNHPRMTFTFEALKICRHKLFLVLGEDKKEALKKVLTEKSEQYPASLVTDCDFYTDIESLNL